MATRRPSSTSQFARREGVGPTSAGRIRFDGAVERATIIFRRKKSLVPVVNISGSGVMIESGIMPRIGEKIGLEFEGFDRLEAVVRWVRKGRIGLDVGEGTIKFG